MVGSHGHDHWVTGGTKPVTPLCMGESRQSVHGEESIPSPHPIHQKLSIIIERGHIGGIHGSNHPLGGTECVGIGQSGDSIYMDGGGSEHA